MEKVTKVNTTTKYKHDLEVQETCQIKILHCYFLKEKKMDIETQKIALEKEVQQRQLALQGRKMVFRKFEAGVCSSYLALDFSFVFSKSSSNKKPLKTVYQKFSNHIRVLSSFFQSSSFKDIFLPPLLQPRL